MTDIRRVSYEARLSPVLALLSFAFLGLYAAPILDPTMPHSYRALLSLSDYLLWALFVADLAIRCYLSEHHLRFIVRHPIELLLVALPMLRPLRVLRVFLAGQTLFSRQRSLLKTGQTLLFAGGLLVVMGALAELDAERSARDASITSFGKALWWAVTTITTVGYGDYYPVTTTGRCVAVALMVVGISLVGLITASVASWMVTRETADQERIARIEYKLDQLLTNQHNVLTGQITNAPASCASRGIDDGGVDLVDVPAPERLSETSQLT